MSNTSKPVSVLGAGGHATVVISTLRAAGYSVGAVYDDDPQKHGQKLLGVRVVGGLEDLVDSIETHAIVAIGDCRVRQNVAQAFKHVTWVTAMHPFAWVDRSVQIGPGSVIFAGAVIQPHAVIGSHVIINTGATVDHDCIVEDFAHLGPGGHLAGGVRIGHGVLLGVGCVVIPNLSVGPGTIVGAGGVVTMDLPGGITAVGVPARKVT